MATSVNGFLNMFPEFTTVAPERIEFWLEFAAGLICSGRFGANSDNAVYMLAAHYLSLSQKRIGAAGNDQAQDASSSIASLAVGDVNVSFDNSKISSYLANTSKDTITQELGMTDYGRMYLSLLRRYGTIATTTALRR